MNDIRRTILWVIFGFSMVMLWDQWQVYNGRKATFFPSPTQTATQSVAPANPASAANSVPTATTSAAGSVQLPGATSTSAPQAGASVAHERVVAQTDVLKVTFDTEGGSLVRAEFLAHIDMADKTRRFVLLDDSKDRVYLAQSGLIAGAGGVALPTHKSVMTLAPGELILKDGSQNLELRFESAEVGGVKLVKTYTLTRGSYAIAVKHEVVNVGAAAVAPQLYMQLVRDGNPPPGESSFYSTFTGPAVYTEAKKYQKVEFKRHRERQGRHRKDCHQWLWPWCSITSPRPGCWDGVQARAVHAQGGHQPVLRGHDHPLGTIAPGATKTIDAKLFAGPQVEKVLEKLAPGLELVKDYGWLTILAKPLYWLLDKLHKLLGNWGWSIVAWCCCSRSRSTGSTPRPTPAWPR
jgi:YidC/Oxa1 family membrane protein insertase